MRPTSCIFGFGVKQCQVVPYINPANQVPGFQTGLVPGIKTFKRLIMGTKTLNIFSETKRPTAYMFVL